MDFIIINMHVISCTLWKDAIQCQLTRRTGCFSISCTYCKVNWSLYITSCLPILQQLTSHMCAPQQDNRCGSRRVKLHTGHSSEEGGCSTNKLWSYPLDEVDMELCSEEPWEPKLVSRNAIQ